jgi:hypothetical protein
MSSSEFALRSKKLTIQEPRMTSDVANAAFEFAVADIPGHWPLLSMTLKRRIPACDYGFELKALEWAALAWVARQYPIRSFFEPVSRYILKASQRIAVDIRYGQFYFTEIFASNLLGWVIYSTCTEQFDTRIHFKGSVNMLSCVLNIIMERSFSTPSEKNLMAFGPFIIDCANAWQVRNGMVPHRSTTFKQRVAYFNDLATSSKPGMWHAGIVEAANTTLGNLLEIALSRTSQIARREMEPGSPRDPIHDVLDYLRQELGDTDFHEALLTIHRSFEGPSQDHSTVQGQLITRLFHRLRAVLLLHSILDADSIREGIATERSVMFGTGLIRACQTHAIRRDGPIEDYYLISWHNYSLLLLGGMTLSFETSADCTHLSDSYLMCSVCMGYWGT